MEAKAGTRPPGRIVTFYSYKGGTGRTMSLANTASILGRRIGSPSNPLRVLAIDWDFEAPGLHRYFEPYLAPEAKAGFADMPGCLDLFEAMRRDQGEFHSDDPVGNRRRASQWLAAEGLAKYAVPTVIPGVEFVKAGRFDGDYGKRVSQFGWAEFFHATQGLFSGIADHLRENYDYVLIDSRTGVTDTSGICTMLLPEKLVVAFTPNHQSLDGLSELVRKAVAYRSRSDDSRPLVVFPLPSRIELSRPELYQIWRHGGGSIQVPGPTVGYQAMFETLFKEVYGLEKCDLGEHFDAVPLQHIADYAYGEPIAAERESDSSRILLGTAYQSFVERLVEMSYPWQSLAGERERREIDRLLDEVEASIAAKSFSPALRSAFAILGRPIPESSRERLVETLSRLAVESQAAEREGARSLLSGLAENALRQRANETDADDSEIITLTTSFLETGNAREGTQAFAGLLAEMESWAEERLARTIMPAKLARLVHASGNLGHARNLQERVVEAYRNVLGTEHRHALEATSHLAITLGDLGDNTRARELQESILAVRRRVLGEEHPDTLAAMDDLASTLYVQGDLKGARAMEESALGVRRRVLGEEHPDTLTSMNNFAAILKSQGDLAGARSLHESALVVRRRLLGEAHPETLTSMNNLASTLDAQGDLAGARSMHELVLAARRRVLGEEHPDTLSSMNNLALALKTQGDLTGAKSLQERVLAVRRRAVGEEHPDTLTAMNNLAGTLRVQGDLEGARRLQESVLAVGRRVLGEEHPATLTAMNNLASTLFVQGDLAGARTLEESVLAVGRRVLGEEHPDTLGAMNNLALTLAGQGDLAGARALQEGALAAFRRVLGDEHPETLTAMTNLAGTLAAQGDPAGAERLFGIVAKRRREGVTAADHRGLFDVLLSLGKARKQLGMSKEAREALAEAADLARVSPTISSQAAMPAMIELLELYYQSGNLHEASRLKEQMAELSSRTNPSFTAKGNT